MRALLLLILTTIATFFVGCKTQYLNKKERKAVRVVNASQRAKDSVVRKYLQDNPPKNDTTYIKGDTVVNTKYQIDSVKTIVPVNHRYTETYTIEKVRVDTAKIIDRTGYEALENRINELFGEVNALKIQNEEYKGKAKDRLWIIIILSIAILGLLYLNFKPQIKISTKN
jgi:hypothetical protein